MLNASYSENTCEIILNTKDSDVTNELCVIGQFGWYDESRTLCGLVLAMHHLILLVMNLY